MPHATGTGRISVRLIVHAGSLVERDGEEGYAHFVEHMAFNGTRHYAPGKLVEVFQRLGIRFGPDLSAETSVADTTYRLDLPGDRASQLPEALQVLRDFADGLQFSPAEVEREKGVILSELRVRDSSDERERIERVAALYEGTPLPDRMPAGKPAAIAVATAESLRSYYQRWYRPNRMTLLIAGDIAVPAVKVLVEKYFATLQGDGPWIPPPEPSALRTGPLRARVIVNPANSAIQVTLVSSTLRSPDTPVGREIDLAAQVVMQLFTRGFSERLARERETIGAAGVVRYPGADARYQHHQLAAQTNTARWPVALAFIESELRRAREQGFGEAELREAIATVLAEQRASADRFSGALPDAIIGDMAKAVAAGRMWHSPSSDYGLAKVFLPTLEIDTIPKVLREILPDGGLSLFLVTPATIEGGNKTLLAAYREAASASANLVRHDASSPLEFRYKDFGAAGTVSTRRTDREAGVELAKLSNGVRLNLMSGKREPNRFRLSARIGHGRSDQPKDKPGLFMLSGALLAQSDVGRHPREELVRLVHLRGVEMNIKFEDQFTITASGPSGELPFALQFLTAFLGDVKLDQARHSRALEFYAAVRQHHFSTTAGRAGLEMMFQITGRDARFNVPAPEFVKAYPFEEVSGWIRTHLLNGPVEIGLVGDFETESALAAAAASVGTLASRSEGSSVADGSPTFISKYYRNIIPTDVPGPAAAFRAAWPTVGATDARVYAALQVGIDALIDRLRITLREELGATYSPGGGVHRDLLQRHFALAWVALSFEPKQAKGLGERTLAIADGLASRGVTREEFARLIEPRRAMVAANLASNEWWLNNVLVCAGSVPATLEEAREVRTIFAKLTRDDVNRALKHFAVSNGSGIVMMPAEESVPPPPKTNAKS